MRQTLRQIRSPSRQGWSVAFCTSCGSNRSQDQKFCGSCGAQVPQGEPSTPPPPSGDQETFTTSKFCTGCGRGLIATASVCPSCGTACSGSPSGVPGSKDKTVALLLAIFLGHWTWLYTYETDQQKFWIATGVWVLGLILTVVGIGFLILLGIYIWSIVDVAQKSNAWFADYPNG